MVAATMLHMLRLSSLFALATSAAHGLIYATDAAIALLSRSRRAWHAAAAALSVSVNFTNSVYVTVGLLLTLFRPVTAFSQTLNVKGQLSTWVILNDQGSSTALLGLRYLPTLTIDKSLPAERRVDAELSMNAYASAPVDDSDDLSASAKAKPYRLWTRFKTSRFEARVGLQKLNFGSATLLRPLMWFDSVDPRDPLQITDGVYGALLRFYLPSNATIWTWGLYGNSRLKGWETSPTREKTPEFGGRVEVPVPRGQFAFTTHHRQADLGRGLAGNIDLASPVTPENRYALDGKWDLGIGLWFEGMVSHQNQPDLARPDQRALNIGADYTFGVDNGLHVLGEFFLLEASHGIFGEGEGARLSAVSVRYPIGLLDSVSGIVYLDSVRHDVYRFASWQRSYDRWQFYVMGFWNPRQAAIQQPGQSVGAGRSPLAGRGIQVMAVFNH